MRAQLIPEAGISYSDKKQLRQQLDLYYEKVDDYLAFASISLQIDCWTHIESNIRKRSKDNQGEKIHVLEVGAGRSGFSKHLKEQGVRDMIHYWTQDVTSQNEAYLASQADHVLLKDISEISDENRFSIIFSTYVLEHVANPAVHLSQLYNLLSDQGSLFIFCPRYDLPGYLCPSSRHLSLFTRLAFEVKRSVARFRSLVYKRPAFLIQTDLAAFHQPFFPDADAVHWTSLVDLRLWAITKGARMYKLKIMKSRRGLKDWIVKQWLTCAVEICKV